MNCKPGELARIVNAPEVVSELNDRIVKLKNQQPHIGSTGVPCWEFEEPIKFTPVKTCWDHSSGRRFLPGSPAFLDGCEDKYLRPIRGGETPEESTEAMRDLHHIPSEVTA